MHLSPWHFRAALNIYHQKGLKYLLRKSIRYINLSFLWRKEDLWWNSSHGLDNAHKKILSSVVGRSHGDSGAGQALLEDAFIKHVQVDQGLPKDYIAAFLQAVEERNVFRNYASSVQDDLLRRTGELDPLYLPCGRWFALQYLCTLNGFFKTACLVRQKAIEEAYLNAGTFRSYNIDMAFRAGIDQAEFGKAHKFLDYLRNSSSISLYKERESFYNLNTGNLIKFQESRKKSLSPIDYKFMEKIKGKSIAIVGPAPSGEAQGKEIDSFDIVIRFNYLGFDKLPDRKEFGNKTNISYYNNDFSTEIAKSGMNPFQEIDFAVFKKIQHGFQQNQLRSQKGRTLNYTIQLFNGKPLAANRVLYDILQFHPSYAKIFNINFYLSSTLYYNGYSANELLKFYEKFNFLSFARHDLISNINFTRNLLNTSLIEVDTVCSKVLKLTTNEYLTALERLFVTGKH